MDKIEGEAPGHYSGRARRVRELDNLMLAAFTPIGESADAPACDFRTRPAPQPHNRHVAATLAEQLALAMLPPPAEPLDGDTSQRVAAAIRAEGPVRNAIIETIHNALADMLPVVLAELRTGTGEELRDAG